MRIKIDGLSYKERLDRLRPFSLEGRRFRGNLIEFYKIMRDIDMVDSQHSFPKLASLILEGIGLT